MFIDCHLHTVTRKGLPRYEESGEENYAAPEELIAIMDRTGVDRGVLLPGVSPECCKQYSPTEDILDVAAKYPDRFIPFCNIDPRAESNSPDANLSRQLRYYQERGCKGAGELCANLYFDDPLVLNLFKHCEACGMPVLFHIGPHSGGCYGLIDDLHLPRLEKCLRLFPKLVFIGHSQPFWAEISADVTEEIRNKYPPGKIAPGGAIPRLLDAYPNLLCDISAGSGYNALTRDAEFGYRFMEKYQDRLLFGTDICSPKNEHKHADFLRKSFADGCISKKTLEQISWQNLNRILCLGL